LIIFYIRRAISTQTNPIEKKTCLLLCPPLKNRTPLVSRRYLGLIAGEELELATPSDDALAVVVGRGPYHPDVLVHEVARVFARGAEVEQVDLVGEFVEEEVGPVGVRLHQLEDEELVQAQTQHVEADLGEWQHKKQNTFSCF